MKIKYVLCPGYVTSKNDGQRHYVGYHELTNLYGVELRECVVFEPGDGWSQMRLARAISELAQDHPNAVWLRPRRDGKYTLPEANQ